MLHVATENCFHISKLIFRAGYKRVRFEEAVARKSQGKISVAPRMTGVAYTNALIREFSLNI